MSSDTIVVDLSNLREAIDNDKDLEKELFEEFISSSTALIAELKNYLADTEDARENWRTTAHSIKGISLNLGAEQLGKLCADAQENAGTTTENEKDKIFHDIVAEHKRVISFLENQ
jgi:HPt (histidine-containing phosphotransfer) domain-containing protein